MGYDFDDFIEDLRAMKDKKEPMKTKRVEIDANWLQLQPGKITIELTDKQSELFNRWVEGTKDVKLSFITSDPEPTATVTPSGIKALLMKYTFTNESRERLITELFGEGWDK